MKVKKVISGAVSMFLALSSCVQPGVFLSTSTAADIDYVGDCGKNAEFSVSSDGTLTIYGDGDLYNYYNDLNTKIFPYKNNIKKIVIGDDIKNIPSRAFEGMNDLEEVHFGDGVSYVGPDAFKNCESLDSLTFGANLDSFDNTPFEKVSSIDFTENSKFRSIDGIVYNRDMTKLLFVSEKNKEMTELNIPDTVTEVNAETLKKLTSLEKIYIGAGIKDVFGIPCGLKTVAEITVSEDNKEYSSIDGVLYNKKKTEMLYYPAAKTDTVLTIPDSVVSIADSVAFPDIEWTEINIGAGLENIPSKMPIQKSSIEAFYVSEKNNYYSAYEYALYDKSRTTMLAYPYSNEASVLNIPDSVETIASGVNLPKSKFTQVNIGRNFNCFNMLGYKYGYDTFSLLEAVNVSESNPYYFSIDGVVYDESEYKMFFYPQAKPDTVLTIPDNIVGVNCYISQKDFTEIILGDSISSLYNIPYTCPDIEYISVSPDNEYFAAEDNVLYDTSMTKVYRVGKRDVDEFVLDENIKYVEEYAFSGCFIDDLIIYNSACKLYCRSRNDMSIKNITGYSGSTAQSLASNMMTSFTALDADTSPLIVVPDEISFRIESYTASYNRETAKKIVGNKPGLTFTIDVSSIKYTSYKCPIILSDDGVVSLDPDFYNNSYNSNSGSLDIIVSDGEESVKVHVNAEYYYSPETTMAAKVCYGSLISYTVAAPDSVELPEGEKFKLDFDLEENGILFDYRFPDSYVGSLGYGYEYNEGNVSFSSKRVSYDVDDTDIISLTYDGYAVALKEGTANITVTYYLEYKYNQHGNYYSSEKTYNDTVTKKIKVYCVPKPDEVVLASFVDENDLSAINYDQRRIRSVYVNENNNYFKTDGLGLYNYDMSEIIMYSAASDEEEYTLPKSFGSCSGSICFDRLSKLNIPDSAKRFSGITLPSAINIYSSSGTIGKDLYADHSELKEVYIEDGVTLIEDNAFADCTSLKKIVIPKSVTGIRYSAFSYAPSSMEIWGYRNSYAQTYAELFGFTFVPLDEGDEPATTTTTTITTSEKTTKTTITTTTVTIKTETTTTTKRAGAVAPSSETTTSTTTTTEAEMTSETTTVTKPRFDTDISVGEMCDMAKKDYKTKTGIYPDSAKGKKVENDTLRIELYDEDGNVLETYYVDPASGIGITESGQGVDLPQTGNNNVNKLIVFVIALLMTLGGAVMIICTREKNKIK